MDLTKVSTKELLDELNKRDLKKIDKILIAYRKGKSLKNIKKEYGSFGIEIIIQIFNMNKVPIPQKLWNLFLY